VGISFIIINNIDTDSCGFPARPIKPHTPFPVFILRLAASRNSCKLSLNFIYALSNTYK